MQKNKKTNIKAMINLILAFSLSWAILDAVGVIMFTSDLAEGCRDSGYDIIEGKVGYHLIMCDSLTFDTHEDEAATTETEPRQTAI